MNYKIKVNRIEKENSNIKGFASIVFGESFKVTNIAILDGRNGLYVQMPRYRTNELDENGNNIYKDFCNPITKEFREELYGNIMKTYESVGMDEMYVGYKQGEEPGKLNYDVNVNAYEKEGSSIKGLARVFFDNSFVVNNVSILSSKDAEFVSMPSYRTSQMDKDGRPVYQDVCYPVTKEFREELYGTVLGEYKEVKDKNITEKQREDKKSDVTKKIGKKMTDKTSIKAKKEEEKEELADTPLKR